MTSDHEQVESVAIVGGGDVGLLTALALERPLEEIDIVVIDDFEDSIPEVGKSTLPYVPQFLHELLDIEPGRLFQNVKLAFKTTSYFEDWCGLEPFHSPLGQPLPIVTQEHGEEQSSFSASLTPEHKKEFHELYYRYKNREFTTLYELIAETPGKTPITFSPRDPTSIERALPAISYQFHSRSFNKFLRTVCRERGIELRNDRIVEVETHDNRIERIAGGETEYPADLYVDASGFPRVLMGQLDNSLVEFDLPVDSAVVTTFDIPYSEVVSSTVVTSGDAGWFWQIDTGGGQSGTRDVGYVYSSSHISDEAARREFVAARDGVDESDELRSYTFDSGVLEKPWVNNCVAVGNALGFVEPLQSTALSAACFLSARLARLLTRHGGINHEGLRSVYNDTTRSTWQEVYDFISIYYKYNSGSTEFWEDARQINPGPIQQVETYKKGGFSAWQDLARLTRTDTDVNDYYLYHHMLRNFDVESEFYESLDLEVDPIVAGRVEEYTDSVTERLEDCLSYEEYFMGVNAGYD